MRWSAFTKLTAGVGGALLLAIGVAAPAAADTTYDVAPVAPTSHYTVLGTLAELDGMLYFPGGPPGSVDPRLWRIDPSAGTAVEVAVAQHAEFEHVGSVVVEGGYVYFVATPTATPSLSGVYRYDPATDAVTSFAGSGLPVMELVFAAGVPYVVDGAGTLAYLDPADPSAPPVAPAPAACSGGGAYGAAENLSAVGDGVAFAGRCGPDDVQLFVYDRATGMSVVDPATVTPAGADISDPRDMVGFGGDLYYNAGNAASDQRTFRFDPDANAVIEPDPAATDPQRLFLFQGLLTWFARDAADAVIVVQLHGDAPVLLPISSYGEFEAAIGAVPWGGRMLVNGFYTGSGGTDATVFVYDPSIGAFTRVVATGAAFVAPFVAADGTGYIVSGSGPTDAIVSRIIATTPAVPVVPADEPAMPVLPATGADPTPWLALGALSVAVGAALLAIRRLAPRARPRR